MKALGLAAILLVTLLSGWVLHDGEHLRKLGAGLVMASIIAAARSERLSREAKHAQFDQAPTTRQIGIGLDELILRAREIARKRVANKVESIEGQSSSWVYRHLLLAGYGEILHGFGDDIYYISNSMRHFLIPTLELLTKHA